MTKKKLPKHKRKKSRLPPEALTVKDNIDYFNLNPVFKFSSVDSNKWTLDQWGANELKDLINTFKIMEQMSWYTILTHRGLNMKAIKDICYPSNISEDITIHEIRICKVKRLFGFIDKNIFNIIWFDRDHSVLPEGKNRKHG